MSVTAAVSVPGKTILFGEHAAVYGHPALVTALGHRMTVTATASPSGRGVVHLELPGVGISHSVSAVEAVRAAAEARESWRVAFEGGDGRDFRPAGQADRLALLAVAESVPEAWLRSHELSVRVVSAIPPGSGFGSSAALAVAVAAACRRACGGSTASDELAGIALRVERQQHGRPSGVDVQAVLRGGALWCRRRESGLEIEQVCGAGLRLSAFRLFDSGAPGESTGEMVAGVRQLVEDDPARAAEAFAAMESAALDGRAAIIQGDDAGLVPIVKRAEAALEAIGVVHERVSAGMRAIEADGGAAKISGAGGRTGHGAGLVLVVHPDPDWHARFSPPAGWIAHGVGLGADGLREEIAA
jgi:mevalonate kinase